MPDIHSANHIHSLEEKTRKIEAVAEQKPPVPYYVYEALVMSHERVKKRLITALVVTALALLVALVGTNAGWLWYNSQYETVDYSYTQDGKGTNIIGTDNEVTYGTETGSPSP